MLLITIGVINVKQQVSANCKNINEYNFRFKDVNECLEFPCLNGGTCDNTQGSYICRCPAGYSGANCEMDIDECLTFPCLYGGTCVNTIGSFYCECPPGRTGLDCRNGELP